MIRKFFYYPLLIFFSLTVTQLSAEVTPPQPVSISNQDQITLEELIKQIQSNSKQSHSTLNELDERIDKIKIIFNELFSIISTLSQMIHEDEISSMNKSRKNESLTNLQTLSSLVQQYQEEKFLHCDIKTCMNIILLTHAIINHIQHALDSGPEKIPPFNLEAFLRSIITKKNKSPESLESIDKELFNTGKKISSLKKNAEHAGLKWYNHFYRAVDSTLIDPSIKYNIPLKASIVGTGTFSALWFWWRFNHGTFEKYTKTVGIYSWFGPDPKLDRATVRNPEGEPTNGATPFDTLGPIAKIDHILSSFYYNTSPLNKLSVGIFVTGLAYEYSKWHSWLKKNIQITHNRLKGGIYLKEAFRHAGSVENVRFADIVGNEEAKQYFAELINYLQNPESYDRLGLTPEKGCLLFGETGTGKTLMVNALYNELELMLAAHGMQHKVKFLRISVNHINTHGIEDLFQQIKQYAPCIAFIDEIDLIDLQRRGKNEHLSQLLQHMSGVFDSKDPKNQVIIIAATNQVESLDKALLREGRFGKKLFFEYPSFDNRITYIKSRLEKLSLDIEKFNIEKIAEQTAGKSYEFLKSAINSAVLFSRTQGHKVCQDDIEISLDKLLRQIINTSTRVVPEQEKKIISAHFSGHAIAMKLLNMTSKPARVTTKQVMTKIREEFMGMHLFKDEKEGEQKRFEYGAIFTSNSLDSVAITTREEQVALCKFYLAGFVSEEVLLGSCGHKCHGQDQNEALEIAIHLVTQGTSIKLLPEEIKVSYFKKAETLLQQYKAEVTTLLTQNKDKLVRIYNALLEKELLSGEEIENLFNNIQSTAVAV